MEDPSRTKRDAFPKDPGGDEVPSREPKWPALVWRRRGVLEAMAAKVHRVQSQRHRATAELPQIPRRAPAAAREQPRGLLAKGSSALEVGGLRASECLGVLAACAARTVLSRAM